MDRGVPAGLSMFTGIILDVGTIRQTSQHGDNRRFTIATGLADQIAIGDSVAISGVCLTAESVSPRPGEFTVTAVAETLNKSKLGQSTVNDRVNLELALRPNDRLGGHIVQGHVDAIGRCLAITPAAGSWIAAFSFPAEFAELVVEKGSITIDGVSLTVYEVTRTSFKVSIIPHTWDATTLSDLRPGSAVNLEFDLIGKFIQRRRELGESALTAERMRQYGY